MILETTNGSDWTHSASLYEPGGALTCDVHGSQTAVILEVLSHAWEVHKYINTALLEDTLGADTAQLQQLGGMDCTSRHNDFLVRLDGDKGAVSRLELDTRSRQVFVHNESAGQGVDQEVVVWPSSVDVEVVTCTGVGASDSPRVLEGREPEDTSLSGTAVWWERDTIELLESFHKGVHAWVVEPGPACVDLRRVTPVGGIILDGVKVIGELWWRLGKVQALV